MKLKISMVKAVESNLDVHSSEHKRFFVPSFAILCLFGYKPYVLKIDT